MESLWWLLINLLLVLIIIFPILWNLSASFRCKVKMAVFLWCVATAGLLGCICIIPFGRNTANHFIVFRIFQILTSWSGISFEFRNRQYLQSDKPFVLVANHQSAIDILGMTYAWPNNCVVMLKKSLLYLPGFNLCSYLCNAVFIDRFSRQNASRSLDDCLQRIDKQHIKVWIFPEGTRHMSDTFLPFKKGAFVLAQRAHIPIVPLVFSSYRPFYDSRGSTSFGFNVKVIAEVLPPISCDDQKDNLDELTDMVRQQMLDVFIRLNAEADRAKHASIAANGSKSS